MIWPKLGIPPETAEIAALTEQWTRVLDELESELILADATAHHWSPPQGLGPLPTSLRDRAGSLARAQAVAVSTLHQSRELASAELAAAAPAKRATAALYLDVMG